jgi:putative redox protein
VVASLDAEDGFSTAMKVGRHYLMADEPEEFGGRDFGPSPYEWISAGLSACTVMTLQLYAKRKGWPLENVQVHTSHNKTHAEDCKQCEQDGSKIDSFELRIKLEGNLSEDQISRLLEIAHRCPVHKTLAAPAEIKIGPL